MKPLFRKIHWRTGRFLLLLYAGLALFGCVASEQMIFQPQPVSYGAGLSGLREIKADDGTPLAVVHLPNATARFTVFYFHGNAEDLGDVAPMLEALHDTGFAVLAFDYRGYGRSDGRASETNVYADTRAIFAFAQANLGLTPERTIIVGRSVGSGPAVEFAARERVAGLALISPFMSAFRMFTRVKLLTFDRFDNIAKIGFVHAPSLIFHGTRDEVIPFAHGQNLFAAAPEPKRSVWIEGAGHNDIFEVAGERILYELKIFTQNFSIPPP
jgi:fermentation-respiration switch protein FrsA (DUF1100 family)